MSQASFSTLRRYVLPCDIHPEASGKAIVTLRCDACDYETRQEIDGVLPRDADVKCDEASIVAVASWWRHYLDRHSMRIADLDPQCRRPL